MPSDLTRFGLTEMLRCSTGVRKATLGATTMDAAAERVCRFLYDDLRWTAPDDADEEARGLDGERQCVMVRVYKTHPYGRLDPELRAFADRMLAGGSAAPDLRCLCLLASVGLEPAWNDRRTSRGHRAIPLPTPSIVEQAPMIAQLVRQFGLDLASVVKPSTEVLPELMGKTYGVFHVEDAVGSPYIPAQQEFVLPYRVRSVVGFGGALRSGDIFAVILFSRARIERDAADRFRSVALDVKTALYDFDESRVFGGG